ncbi:MAG: ribosome maturation factor RimP [Gammaproteobacteria bacterium]|nr:MAG: ribosome maturation factor RimP [Gammaproteobacteria bacterium]
MRRASESIVAVVRPVVEGLGYVFVGAEFGVAENGPTLRVFIDKPGSTAADVAGGPGGVDIDDCVAVSQQLDGVLDVEDVIAGAYSLEVSSPGLDRPLFTEAHFVEQIGETVKLRLERGLDGRRNFKGRLVSVEDGRAEVEVDGTRHSISLADVEKANLVGRIETLAARQ